MALGAAAGFAAAAAKARELSAADVEALLEDLVAAYKRPSFRQELAQLQAACLKSGTNPILVMGPTC